MIAARVRLYRFTLPLVRPLTMGGTTHTERTGYLLALTDEAGNTGWGEASPLPGFSDETSAQAGDRLRRCVPKLTGYRIPENYDELEGAGLIAIEGPSSVSFAIETAYLNLRAAQEGVPLYRYLNPIGPETLESNGLLAGDDAAFEEGLAEMARAGYRAVKLKVGGRDLGDDIARVARVRETLGPDAVLRLDANCAWPLADAVAFSEGVEGLGVAYVEEPVDDAWDLELYHEAARIPYAVDETLYRFHRLVLDSPQSKLTELPEDFGERATRLTRIIGNSAATIWKPTFMHVPRMGEDIATRSFALPIHRLVLSAAFESGVGLNAVAQYASAFGAPDMAVGLDTYRWLAEDVLQERLPFDGATAPLAAMDAAARNVDTDRLECLADLEAEPKA